MLNKKNILNIFWVKGFFLINVINKNFFALYDLNHHHHSAKAA